MDNQELNNRRSDHSVRKLYNQASGLSSRTNTSDITNIQPT